ncbi:unnamed protein product, partial [Dovyalis caffra]
FIKRKTQKEENKYDDWIARIKKKKMTKAERRPVINLGSRKGTKKFRCRDLNPDFRAS